jgi:preprotein translocase subunit SecG
LILLKTALIIIDLLVCLTLIAIVIMQSGKSSGLSALSGSSDTFMARNKSKTLDAKLSRSTKWVAGAFVVLTLVLTLI